ncbi:MAG: hypothetical protein ACRDQX_07235, partial [Pseudonocardiaceae bacterium]
MRLQALREPWSFRDVVASLSVDQPGIRNALLYRTFPQTFFPIVNQDHKRAIRDSFASVIGGASGLLAALNSEIGAEGRDYQIGPSYLMTPDAE